MAIDTPVPAARPRRHPYRAGLIWDQLGLTFDPANSDHAETANAVTQITGGNFRLIERLMTQIARVMSINQLETITPDVVHAARQILVIGSQ